MKEKLKIVPLGGLNEIGKNMTAIECGNDIIIIDAGLTFPDEELPAHVLGCAGARFSLRSWETWRSQEACGSRRFFETRSGGIAVDGLAEAAGGPAACDPHGVRFSGSNLQLKTAGRTESAG